MQKIKVVGLDPSFRNWGVAVMSYSLSTGLILEDVDVIKTKPQKSKLRKSVQDLNDSKTLINGVYELVEDADVVVIELPHGSQSAAAMKSYGICIALCACLTRLDIKFIYKTALDVKKVVGAKDTTKHEIVSWVEQKHPNKLSKYMNSAEHQADATVVVHSAINQIKEIYHGFTNHCNPRRTSTSNQ